MKLNKELMNLNGGYCMLEATELMPGLLYPILKK
jgi:hypothetical protein